MNYIKYRNGHSIPKELIMQILKDLGCENIKDLDYDAQNKSGDSARRFVPDFKCQLHGADVAIEVGTLSCNNKIQKLLEESEHVLHIFADSRLFLLHSVLYTRKVLVRNNVLSELEANLDRLTELTRKATEHYDALESGKNVFE